MKMILKYPLGMNIHHNAVYEVDMPRGAKILDVQLEGDMPVIWAIVNPKRETRKYVFQVFATGFEMHDYEKKNFHYLATVQQKGLTTFVWHIFEVYEQ